MRVYQVRKKNVFGKVVLLFVIGGGQAAEEPAEEDGQLSKENVPLNGRLTYAPTDV